MSSPEKLDIPHVDPVDGEIPSPVATKVLDDVPEGGYGWICVLAVGIINCFVWGQAASYGVYLSYYLANDTFHDATSFDYAVIGGLEFAVALFIAPLVTITTRTLGTRFTMSIGVLVHACGFIAASFATKISHLYATQGFMIGVGIGFMFIPSVTVLPQWFHKRRTLAQGFSSAGSGVGGIIFSLGTHAMIDGISLAWSLRITGILCFAFNLLATILLRDRNAQVKPMQVGFASYLLKRPEVILLLLYSFVNLLGYMVLLYSLSAFAVSIGLTQSQASNITALLNLGTAIGRPAVGFASDRWGRLIIAGSLSMFTGICCFIIWIPANSYGVLIFYAILAGMTIGTFWMTVAPLAAEVAGLREVPSLLSLTWLAIVLPCLFAEVIGLYIRRDGSRPYLWAQVFTGLAYIVSSLFLAALWRTKRRADHQQTS
ncbi:hypothetical protein AAFC00_005295 [Neodothiora populina]|uniref:Major facilitator superfamily (MFS) profile domain-containing protein n=1 Tax=Neodothiora populina TaxID=2781224 RepID=A0ABR3PKE2_9PEZI